MTGPRDGRWVGRVAVVTGSASGIGLALARRFAKEGMTVVLADHDASRLAPASHAVEEAGATAVLAVETDVAQQASVKALADRVRDEFGDVHLLCNNAGVIRPGTSWETTAEDWDASMAVNVGGVVNGIRAFVPRMLDHGRDCHVVNTASAAGLFAAPSFAGYCASKAAVIALTEALAAEVATLPDARMAVSVLCPGGVATDLFRTEVHRRAGGGVLSNETADRWTAFSNPERTDQMAADDVAEMVWAALQERTFWIVPMQPSLLEAARSRVRTLDDALAAAQHASPDPAEESLVRRYYERVDGPTPAAALDLLADDLVFSLARPERRIEGTSRQQLGAYIRERGPLTHPLLATARVGDVEFALGESMDGDTVLGTFIAAVRADPAGRLDRYVAAFYPDVRFASAPSESL
jgi:NAD(P)-dependent dehydrogenase (short-subunit alcohol dehydrogenase family)